MDKSCCCGYKLHVTKIEEREEEGEESAYLGNGRRAWKEQWEKRKNSENYKIETAETKRQEQQQLLLAKWRLGKNMVNIFGCNYDWLESTATAVVASGIAI